MFTGYYRRCVNFFFKDYRPLTYLLPPTSVMKIRKKQERKKWKWTEIEQAVFDS